MENKNVVDKIKRLLALSDKGKNTSDHEAEAALLKAHELMAKYNISVETTKGEIEIAYVHEQAKSKWNMGFRKPLAVIISKNFRCECYLTGSQGAVTFFGRESDAKIARQVFEFAYDFALREGNRHYNKNYQMGLETRGVFNSYVKGFLTGLKQKLDEQSTALMVVTPPDVVEKFEEMTKSFARSKGGMQEGRLNAAAYLAGIQDGKNIMGQKQLQA